MLSTMVVQLVESAQESSFNYRNWLHTESPSTLCVCCCMDSLVPKDSRRKSGRNRGRDRVIHVAERWRCPCDVRFLLLALSLTRHSYSIVKLPHAVFSIRC